MPRLLHTTALLAVVLSCGCFQGVESEFDASGPTAREPGVAWNDLVPNARQPLDGVVSGGQPTAEQLAQAAAAGFKTVINLRMPGERGTDDEAAQVAGFGMEYVALPIPGADGITEKNARELVRLLEVSERPVLLHCGSGNRIGALLALSSYYVDGRSPEEAIQYGLDSGMTRLEPVVREHLASVGGD